MHGSIWQHLLTTTVRSLEPYVQIANLIDLQVVRMREMHVERDCTNDV